MNKQTISLTILLLFALGAVNAQTTNDKKAEKSRREVIETIDRLAEAGMKRDVATIEALHADDFIHTNADGSQMTKDDILKDYQRPSAVKVESNAREDKKVYLDGDTAIVTTKVVFKGSADGQSFTHLFRVTYVLKKKKKQWQVIASHASLLANELKKST
jgi:ketosteroid isomerase-like protein